MNDTDQATVFKKYCLYLKMLTMDVNDIVLLYTDYIIIDILVTRNIVIYNTS